MPVLQQQEIVIHSQKALNDVSPVLRPFAPGEKAFLVDSCQILSQLAAMHDSGNVPVANSADHESQHMKLQNLNCQPAVNQQVPTTAQGMSNKQPIHPGVLLSMMLPQVDKDQARQLEAIYDKLRVGAKDLAPFSFLLKFLILALSYSKGCQFLMNLKGFVGDQTLRMAIHKLQSQAENEQNTPQFSAHSEAEAQQWQS